MLVNYRHITENDIPWVVEISDLQFGKNYLNEERLMQYISDVNTSILVSASGRLVIGFSILHYVKKKDLFRYINPKFASFFEEYHPGLMLQVRKSTAIHPEFAGRGFGQKFIRYTTGRTEKRCDGILSFNWKRHNKVSMEGILQTIGMKVLAEIPDYWHDDSLKYGYQCPECGQPPCHCTAVVYCNL